MGGPSEVTMFWQCWDQFRWAPFIGQFSSVVVCTPASVLPVRATARPYRLQYHRPVAPGIEYILSICHFAIFQIAEVRHDVVVLSPIDRNFATQAPCKTNSTAFWGFCQNVGFRQGGNAPVNPDRLADGNHCNTCVKRFTLDGLLQRCARLCFMNCCFRCRPHRTDR